MGKIIWLIDENENQLRTYIRKLKRLMPDSITIRQIFPPYRQKEEYISILNDPSTSCIILDQRLKDTGIATYTGIELAQYLRGVNKKLPIYILTNFAEAEDEFIGGKWSVEDIIPKDALNDEEQLITITARILRRIDIHEDILAERTRRFDELLKKSMKDELSEAELQELKALQFERIAPTLADEIVEQQALDQIIKTNKDLIDLLNQISQEDNKNVDS
ncbi:MAG: hypothetical protein U0401_01355 [Anaerolineae bacterium]